MGKNKSFDTDEVLIKIAQLFVKRGYNGSSLDDIVEHTGLLRGSLYGTFGSKLGMFVAALELCLRKEENDLKWGLLIVAMLEVTARNEKVFNIVQEWYLENQHEEIAKQLGLMLLQNSGIMKRGQ
ncbi:hypothetical protein GCM10025879_02060 [Leuconostoc litchii]|uniref:TetR/AcrR family transcriptional regulator n=1 Tax=Leuconostoc litchii TaxID=1981069 RepID=A0A6P2CMC1_9LACO|nr:TetR/AcrR family transcriptional regulator [Leuconostoc litchii]TYC47036.1 TetR/AcrR family transcriptional regulator [Leuconostoc litchii]GMA68960.1 hypothetical protein GCM10025879_02060 [Leuconostoc litchii]